MNRQFCRVAWLVLFAVGIANSLFAQAPLVIESSSGFADRATLMDSAWFRVPATNGYSYAVLLDGRPVPADLTNVVNRADYHELSVSRTNMSTLAVSNRLIRFIIVSSQRSKSTSSPPETGLIVWTPYPPIYSAAGEFAGAQLHVVAPQDYPMGLDIPIIARVDDAEGNERRANGLVTAPGFETQAFKVRRGWGFGFLNPATNAGAIAYNAQLTSLEVPKLISIETDTAWIRTNGTLAGNVAWPENSRIYVTQNLAIPAGASLTIGAGTIIKINPLVNITNNGRLVINGTTERPVVFTATNRVAVLRPAGAWGGFIVRGSSAVLEAQGAIITGAGGATTFSFSPGASHRDEQAALLIHSGAKAYLTNCYVVNQAGQVANVYASDTIYDHCLLQRAITSGEYSGGGTHIINHSAVIEFPEEIGFVNATIADDDYDAIYFTEGTQILMNSVFGFAKDDAIDSGSGGKGTVLVTNCWVESALHEAHAWSGNQRTALSFDSVLLNCGQGHEAGWTDSENEGSPDCFADRMLTTANSIGARFGDNYNWTYYGRLKMTNSLILHNYRDVFLKTWNTSGSSWNTNQWVDRLRQTDLRSNYLTCFDARFPSNQAWDPAADGWRLAHWMTTPPDAPVGIGLATWTNWFPMTNIVNGVPVRLSSFTTHDVSVDYSFVSDAVTLGAGTLTFAPGETVKMAYPAGFDISKYSQIQFVLSNPIQGELTTLTNITFQGGMPVPRMSLGVLTNRLPAYRFPEGLFVLLSSPSAEAVSLDYTCEASGQTLASGTLRFNPLETSRQLFLPGVNPFAYESIRVSVGNPAGATLTGLTSLTFTNPPQTIAFGETTNQASLAVLETGLAVNLGNPSGGGVSVEFRLEGPGGLLTNGVLAFGPGESVQWLTVPAINLDDYDVLRVSLSNPVGAQFSGVTNLYLVRTVTAPPAVNTTFVRQGADWRFLDTGANLGLAWSAANPGGWTGFVFSDSAWDHGPSPLGYNSGETTTLGFGPSSTSKFLTYYFRHAFTITNAAGYSNLTFNLRRDDGAVVYLNGPEVYRENMPTGLITTNSTSTTNVGNTATMNARTFAVGSLAQGLREGTNLLAVEIHQNNVGSSDILLDLELIGIPAPQPDPPRHVYLTSFEAGQFTLAWGNPAYRIQQSDKVTGPWTNNLALRSPVFINPTNNQIFFRLRKP